MTSFDYYEISFEWERGIFTSPEGAKKKIRKEEKKSKIVVSQTKAAWKLCRRMKMIIVWER